MLTAPNLAGPRSCVKSLKLQLLLAFAERHKLNLLQSNSVKHSNKAQKLVVFSVGLAFAHNVPR
jgi:hypothetical protein